MKVGDRVRCVRNDDNEEFYSIGAEGPIWEIDDDGDGIPRVSANAGAMGTSSECNCIGSRCMMWVPTDDGRGSCGLSRG